MFQNIENSTAADISFHVGGRFFQVLFLSASFFGVFASGLASHASVSRLLYVMGRDNMLPKRAFGSLSKRFATPTFNIALVGIVCLFAMFFTVETAVHFISFGSLIAFSFVNLAVIIHYVIKGREIATMSDIFHNLIAPTAGLIFIVVLWLSVKQEALILGLSWGAIGVAFLVIRKILFKVSAPSEVEVPRVI